MSKLLTIFFGFAAIGGLFLFMLSSQEVRIHKEDVETYTNFVDGTEVVVIPDYEMRNAPMTIGNPAVVFNPPPPVSIQDTPPQQQLKISPRVIKGVYATSWSMSSQKKIDYFLKLIDTTELNAIIIDIKDFSGFVAYDTQLKEVERYGAKQIRIARMNGLIKALHDKGIYVIARISVFQDPILAKARPDLAVKSARTGSAWYDRKGLAWTDPSNKEVWDYTIAIAKEAASRGFDEINFDYIRFPSDGDLADMVFSHWDKTVPRNRVMRNFYEYLYHQMKGSGAKISADLFGLTASQSDDLGIGQIIENAYPFFDAVSPMVYPSHYAKGFLGFQNPAAYPAEIVQYSVEKALNRLFQQTTTMMNNDESNASSQQSIVNGQLLSKLRPWLQDFDLGADYTAAMVRGQINATYRAACKVLEKMEKKEERETEDTTEDILVPKLIEGQSIDSPSPGNLQLATDNCNPKIGWMLWNPSNIYTVEALDFE